MTAKKSLQPLDRTALALMLVLTLLIGILVWSGDRTLPLVRDFSWQAKQVGVEDAFFTLTFSRPMDEASVEASLQIVPHLPGKISWAGRRTTYTLTAPVAYGTSYKVRLEGATDRFRSNGHSQKGKLIEPFTGEFSTRERAFAYVGVSAQEKGRLILYNLSQNKKTLLTPKSLVVGDFKPYPQGDRILFSAADWSNNAPGLFEQQLYSVTTGMPPQSNDRPWGTAKGNRADVSQEPPGTIERVLDNRDYQNLKFDLFPNGQAIVVQRVNRDNLGEFGLWVVRTDEVPKPLNNQPGGDFLITPDSETVAISHEEGVSILPLTPNAKPLDFLPEFAKVLSFAKDGSAAAMVKSNSDYTRSLFLVTTQGIEKELLHTNGIILDAKFAPLSTTIYCLYTQLKKEEQYEEKPYLVAIDLKTSQVKQLLVLPKKLDIQMSLSPDGLALMFDEVVTTSTLPTAESLTTNEGKEIASSRLWLLPLTPNTAKSTSQVQPKLLPLQGFHPRWLP